MKNVFKNSQKSSNLFLKPVVSTLVPVIGMAVGAKAKNLHAQATRNIINSISGGKNSCLTGMHGYSLGLKVECFHFK